jgi:hypothetical protein
MKRSYNTMEQFFLGCFWNLWAKNSRTQINKCINYLPGEGEHRGLDLSPRCFLLPSFLVSCDPRDSIARTVHNQTFAWVINLLLPLFYFTSCSLSSCASINFLQNKALAFPRACPFHVPKMPNGGHVMHHEAQYINEAQKPPVITFRC